MGIRLHVCKKYDVEYANIQAFKYKLKEFQKFCKKGLGMNLLQDDDSDYPWNFEIGKRDWMRGIQMLKDFDRLDEDEQEIIVAGLKTLDVEIDEMIEIMECFLKEADPRWDQLIFSYY